MHCQQAITRMRFSPRQLDKSHMGLSILNLLNRFKDGNPGYQKQKWTKEKRRTFYCLFFNE